MSRHKARIFPDVRLNRRSVLVAFFAPTREERPTLYAPLHACLCFSNQLVLNHSTTPSSQFITTDPASVYTSTDPRASNSPRRTKPKQQHHPTNPAKHHGRALSSPASSASPPTVLLLCATHSKSKSTLDTLEPAPPSKQQPRQQHQHRGPPLLCFLHLVLGRGRRESSKQETAGRDMGTSIDEATGGSVGGGDDGHAALHGLCPRLVE